MIPAHVGACEFGHRGKLIAVRCPREFDALMRNAGGQCEAGSRRWLIERYRIGPVIRALYHVTDPLFRQAGIELNGVSLCASRTVAVALIVALAMAVNACSFNASCRGPYGEPCGGPRSGWPGAVTCPSC